MIFTELYIESRGAPASFGSSACMTESSSQCPASGTGVPEERWPRSLAGPWVALAGVENGLGAAVVDPRSTGARRHRSGSSSSSSGASGSNRSGASGIGRATAPSRTRHYRRAAQELDPHPPDGGPLGSLPRRHACRLLLPPGLRNWQPQVLHSPRRWGMVPDGAAAAELAE